MSHYRANVSGALHVLKFYADGNWDEGKAARDLLEAAKYHPGGKPPQPTTAIEMIKQLRKDGLSYQQICYELEAAGIETATGKRVWGISQVWVICNPKRMKELRAKYKQENKNAKARKAN